VPEQTNTMATGGENPRQMGQAGNQQMTAANQQNNP